MIGWILFLVSFFVLVLVAYFHNKMRTRHKSARAALNDIEHWCETITDPDLPSVIWARALQGLHERNKRQSRVPKTRDDWRHLLSQCLGWFSGR